jgi:hypothetical protein
MFLHWPNVLRLQWQSLFAHHEIKASLRGCFARNVCLLCPRTPDCSLPGTEWFRCLWQDTFTFPVLPDATSSARQQGAVSLAMHSLSCHAAVPAVAVVLRLFTHVACFFTHALCFSTHALCFSTDGAVCGWLVGSLHSCCSGPCLMWAAVCSVLMFSRQFIRLFHRSTAACCRIAHCVSIQSARPVHSVLALQLCCVGAVNCLASLLALGLSVRQLVSGVRQLVSTAVMQPAGPCVTSSSALSYHGVLLRGMWHSRSQYHMCTV